MTIQAKFESALFGQVVRQRRQQKEMSVTTLAVMIGVNKSTIDDIEAGKTTPKLQTAIALCHALQINIQAFWRIEVVPSR